MAGDARRGVSAGSARTPNPGIEEAIRDREQLPPGAAIDVGSGIGHIAAHLGSAFTPSVAFDIARSALVEGRTRFPELPVGVADARVLPVRDGCAALVVCRGCIHVFPAAEFPGYLEELARVLAPGGRLVPHRATALALVGVAAPAAP